MPVSAATVTGVVCEAALFADRPTSAWRAGVRLREAADPDAPSGWSSAIADPAPTRLRTAAGVGRRDDGRSAGRRRSTRPAGHRRGRARRSPPPSPPRQASARARTRWRRRGRRAARRSSTANTKEQPDPGERGHGDGRELNAPVETRGADDDADEDHDHEEAPVDRQAPEQRVDTEERLVRVPDGRLRPRRRGAPRARRGRRREEDAHYRGQLRVEERHEPRTPRQTGEREREQPERQVEEQQLHRALLEIDRPRERKRPLQATKRASGSATSRARASARHAFTQLPGQQRARRRNDDVERDQQIRLRRAKTVTGTRAGASSSVANASAHGRRRRIIGADERAATPSTAAPA